MEYKIEITSEINEDIVILAKEKSPLLFKLEALLKADGEALYGYGEKDIQRLDKSNVYAFFVEAGKVYAKSENEKLLVKERLYILEEKFSSDFIKINQSCLIRVDKIARFRTTIGGSLEVLLKNGYTDYVSRRQLKKVKERLGI
jgi:DNA-binding LytR/AlgR family response regulator